MFTPTGSSLATALADRYRFVRELGQGGMATVYLARDLKHDRDVAIKVLRPELAAVLGADRFVVEIRTTAALQHPHILPLFDSGTADGVLYYVMPYLDGETVRDKLNRETQFGVDEAVRIAHEVADALGYAHRHGVIHRDIKPENILLHDGRAMVMDFGIALAVSAAAGGRMTETGLSLGTPHYMSPEQATAEKDLTLRSDIYSLACVLYEMLAGNPPHLGGSAQQIIMRIITEAPRSVAELRRSVPPNVAAAIAKGLEKLPADRFENAKAFSDALATSGFSYATASLTSQGTAVAVAPATSPGRGAMLGLAGIAVAALIVAGWAWLRPARQLPAMTFDLTLRPALPSDASDVKISPDGSMLVYAGVLPSGQRGIFLRHLHGTGDFKMIAGTEGGSNPSFSPDNAWIVFRRADGSFATISVGGGGTRTVLRVTNVFHPQWGVNQQVFYTGRLGAFVVPAAGGAPKPLVRIGGRVLSPLPDGSGVLAQDPVGAGIVIYDLKTDSVAVVLPYGRHPVYTANGYLLYADDQGGLSAVPFDLKRRRVTGVPVRVLDRVAAGEGARGYSVSNNGTLVWHVGTAFQDYTTTRLVLRTFDGQADTLRLPAGRYLNPRISPDGRFVAYGTASRTKTNQGDIFVYDLTTKTNRQITFGELNSSPIWSPKGTHILYAAGDSTNAAGRRLRIEAADNSGAAEVLAEVPPEAKPTAWPRDDLILYTASTASDDGNLMMISTKPGSKPQPYLASPLYEDEATLSLDERLVAYVARENDRFAVWLREFPAGVGQWRLGTTRMAEARWAPDGNSVYYWGGEPRSAVDTLFRVPVDRSPVVPRAPVVVATMDMQPAFVGRNWDLHPDRRRVVVVVPDRAAQPTATDSSRYVIILNWFTKLDSAMARARK